MLTPVEFIQSLVDRFGPRAPASEAERQAQKAVAEQFEKDFGPGSVTHAPFHAAVTAKFQSLKLFCFLLWLTLALAWWSSGLAAALALINAVVFMGHFVLYQDWLDRFWPSKESANVWADLEPQGEASSTLILAGHVDSATEFQWWYRWGHPGLLLTILGGFTIVLSALFLLFIALAGPQLGSLGQGWQLAWGIMALLSISAWTLFTIHGDRGVDGAIDNLSGLAAARAIGLAFRAEPGRSKLQHTRLRIMSFGSEECGLKGSRAYVAQQHPSLLAENAVLINLESFRDDRFLTALTGELFTGARYHASINNRLEEAFKQTGKPWRAELLALGATDATSFANRGLPATCLIGLDPDHLDPTYHTRRDNLTHLDPAGMEAVTAILERFVGAWDADADSR